MITARNRSKAKAEGIRADAVSALGNMWAYVTLLCCHEEDGGQDERLSFAFDNALFNLKELNDPRTVDRLPRLKEHVIKSGKILKTFQEGVKSAGEALKQHDCKEAKKKLQETHAKLKEMVKDLERKQDPEEPGDD